jgi:putative resolvase
MINEKLYNPKEATKILGVTVKTLQRWDKLGKIKVLRTPTNQRMIPESEIKRILSNFTGEMKTIAIYARVSSNEQKTKGDLQRQVDYIKTQLDKNIYSDIIEITDVGSGLNDKRKGLLKLMKMAQDGEITDVAIRYKDRLTRFGFNYLEMYFNSHSVNIHILNEDDKQKTIHEELVEDLLSIVTSFSGRLYGIRSNKNRTTKDKMKEVIKGVFVISDQA